jgi:hypothetical protein
MRSSQGTSLRPCHLPQPGHSRHGDVTPVVRVTEQRKLTDEHRARSHQRHLAGEHIEQLWELVKAPAPQESAERGDAWV